MDNTIASKWFLESDKKQIFFFHTEIKELFDNTTNLRQDIFFEGWVFWAVYMKFESLVTVIYSNIVL